MKNRLYRFTLLILTIMFASCEFEEKVETKVSSGKLERYENFESSFVNPRNIDVWLPDNYNSSKNYSVLYMHDGQMLFDANVTWNKQEWMVDETVSKLIIQKQIPECIVVGIWNIEDYRHRDYFPQKPYETLDEETKLAIFEQGLSERTGSDNYLKFIVEEVKPFIDKSYSTKSAKENTYIAGSSMGGLISIYAICEYPDVFEGAACISTHWPGATQVEGLSIPTAFNDYLKNNLPDPKSHKIYFDFGTETLDQLYEPLQRVIDQTMIEKGWNASNWTTKKFEGENHSENSWNKRLDIPLTFIMN